MYKINLKPKRKSGSRPRSIDSIRLEARRDGDKLEEFRCSFFITVYPECKKTDYHYELRQNLPYTLDELQLEMQRFISRANSRLVELREDHQINDCNLKSGSPLKRIYEQRIQAYIVAAECFKELRSPDKIVITGYDGSIDDLKKDFKPGKLMLPGDAPAIEMTPEKQEELMKEFRNQKAVMTSQGVCKIEKKEIPDHLSGMDLKLKVLPETDSIGRRRRKTSDELVLDAIDRAGYAIRDLGDIDFRLYLKTLARIRAMSRCPQMLKIRLLEVAECVAEIEVEETDLERQTARGICFNATKQLDFILQDHGVK